jgi:hypothetical protein
MWVACAHSHIACRGVRGSPVRVARRDMRRLPVRVARHVTPGRDVAQDKMNMRVRCEQARKEKNKAITD